MMKRNNGFINSIFKQYRIDVINCKLYVIMLYIESLAGNFLVSYAKRFINLCVVKNIKKFNQNCKMLIHAT
jgi:hypothetical protein